MQPVILQPSPELYPLRGRQWNSLRNGSNAVPDFFHKLDALGYAQLKHVSHRYFAHDGIVSSQTARDKIACFIPLLISPASSSTLVAALHESGME